MDTYPYVDFARIQGAAYGMDIPSEAEDSVTRLISKAGERLAARVPRLEERVSAGKLSVELVAGVIEDMVIRVVRNPFGYAQEQAGDFMYRIDKAVASGLVEVRAEDVATLRSGSTGTGFGRVRMKIPGWRLP